MLTLDVKRSKRGHVAHIHMRYLMDKIEIAAGARFTMLAMKFEVSNGTIFD